MTPDERIAQMRARERRVAEAKVGDVLFVISGQAVRRWRRATVERRTPRLVIVRTMVDRHPRRFWVSGYEVGKSYGASAYLWPTVPEGALPAHGEAPLFPDEGGAP